MPRDWWAIYIAAGTDLDLPRALVVLKLSFTAAQHVADVGGVGVAHMGRPRRKRATRNTDLGVFVELLAGFLALPLDGQGVRDILAQSSKRRDQESNTYK